MKRSTVLQRSLFDLSPVVAFVIIAFVLGGVFALSGDILIAFLVGGTLGTILFLGDSRVFFACSLLFLIACASSLALHKGDSANTMATYSFYFFSLGMIVLIIQNIRTTFFRPKEKKLN